MSRLNFGVSCALGEVSRNLFSAIPVDDLEDLVGGAPGRVEGLGEGGRLPDLHAALHDAEEGHRHGAHGPPPAGLVAFLQQNYIQGDNSILQKPPIDLVPAGRY